MHYSKDFLSKEVSIVIDRPMGSRHHKWGFLYPLNYGYVPNTKAPDGAGVDAYVLGVFEPLETFTGRCIAVIQRENNDDDKLILVPEGKNYTDEQIIALTEFQEKSFKIMINRE
jgi:inorganic pyrophosphatase